MNRLEIGIEEVEEAFCRHSSACTGLVEFGLAGQGGQGGEDFQRIGTFWEINNQTIIENPSILFKKKTDMFMHDVVLNGDVPIDLDFDRMFVDTELIDGGLWKG